MTLRVHPEEIIRASKSPLLGKHPSWERKPLGAVADVLNGYAFKSSFFNRDRIGMPLLRIRDVGWDSTQAYYSGDYDPRYVVRPGDLVIGMDGDFRIARWEGPPALLNQRVCKVIIRETHVCHPTFLLYLLPGYLDAIHRLTSSLTVKHLSSKTVLEIPIPLPPPEEQQTIIGEIEKQFTRLDAAVAALKRVRASLQRYRAAVFDAAITGRLVVTESAVARVEARGYESAETLLARILKERRKSWEISKSAKLRPNGRRPTNDSRCPAYTEPSTPETAELPDLPEAWTWATMDQLANPEPNAITDGPFGSNLKTSHYTQDGPRVIRLQNIGDSVFIDEQAHISQEHFEALAKHQVHEGDLVIAALATRPPRACVMPSWVGPAIVKADCIRFGPSKHLSPMFLNAALNAEQTRKRTETIVHGVGRPRLNLGEIKAIALPVPPAAEQSRIAAELERRLSLVAEIQCELEVSLQRVAALRDSILAGAFSGHWGLME